MTTEQRNAAIAATIEHLEWFRIPRTIDHIIGVYAEATREQSRPMRHGLSNEDIVAEVMKRNVGGGSGHADPTPQAALYGEPDAIDDDETLPSIDHAVTLILETAELIDTTCAQMRGLLPRQTTPWAGRQDAIAHAVAHLHHARPHIEAAIVAGADDLDQWIRTDLAETAEWLHTKCAGIWSASKGETRTIATQQPGERPAVCKICSPWRSNTIGSHAGRCDDCDVFFRNHQAEAIEGIVRRWEYGKGATPALVLEAKAAMKTKKGKRAS